MGSSEAPRWDEPREQNESIENAATAITTPMIVITSLAGDEFKWLGVVVNAIVLTVFSWLIFVYGLKLTIPMWPLFITG